MSRQKEGQNKSIPGHDMQRPKEQPDIFHVAESDTEEQADQEGLVRQCTLRQPVPRGGRTRDQYILGWD